jgi:hypothetical protein
MIFRPWPGSGTDLFILASCKPCFFFLSARQMMDEQTCCGMRCCTVSWIWETRYHRQVSGGGEIHN